MIPKILHQVWIGPRPLPEKYRVWQQRWRELHPDWEYRLWTDDDVPSHVRKVMDLNPVVACKSSVLRIYAVLTHGGVYTDTDTQWNKNIDALLECEAFAALAPGTEHYANAVFAATPGHECWKWQWEHLPEHAGSAPPWGPQLLTLAIAARGERVTTYPSGHFYPRSWQDPAEDAAAFPEAYLVHHADHTWRDWKEEWEE